MTTDIIIVNYFSSRDVERCLETLGYWTKGTIWLVDNSCDSEQAQSLAEICRNRSDVKILLAFENLGFGRACNWAFDQSNGNFVLLLNPDAQIDATSLNMLINLAQSDPTIGAVSPNIYWNARKSFVLPPAFSQTPWVRLGLSLLTHSRYLSRWAAQRWLKGKQGLLFSKQPFKVQFLAGAVLLLRRSAVVDAGGLFDPEYFMFYEDSDLSLRLRQSDFSLVVHPAASAVHEYRHKAFKAALMSQSERLYYRKRFHWFYIASGNLARIRFFATPIEPVQWFDHVLGPCRSAKELNLKLGGGHVIALSPSALMMPAMVRCEPAATQSYSQEDWELLEDGNYTAFVRNALELHKGYWYNFDKTSSA